MSPVALSLNLLLAILLLAALALGWRLDRRLKALRDSHAGFATAVADLDRAAKRAESGLTALRTATDEALELLIGRIDKAREMAAKLDHLTSQAETRVGRGRAAPAAAASAPAAPAAMASVRRRPVEPAPIVDAEAAVENLVLRLSSHDAISTKPSPRADGPGGARWPDVRLSARPEPGLQRRSRATVDDDLFDAPPALGRVMPGGRS